MNVEKKRERKRKLIATASFEKSNSAGSLSLDVIAPKRMPKIDIQEIGSILHIFLVTSLEHKFMFHEIIRLLNEELEAEVTHAGYSTVDDAIFHTLHCKVINPKNKKTFFDFKFRNQILLLYILLC